mmetsp:Transcript_95233/g.213286  ORF Transcript_95233/g.213286 Transcript_95233/m.213286 type:complete len:263 (-) Transcript_95233:1127-1915(-)
MELIRYAVHDLRDLVAERVDLRLQHLGGDAEVADANHPDDGADGSAWDHCVDAHTRAPHVVGDDVGAGLAKPESEQRPELDDGLLQNHRLQGLLPTRVAHAAKDQILDEALPTVEVPLQEGLRNLLRLELVVGHLHGDEWVVADGLDPGNHLLHRPEDESARVVRKHHRPENQEHHHKERHEEVVLGIRLHVGSDVEVEDEVPIVRLARSEQPWRNSHELHAAQIIRALHGGVDHATDPLLEEREAPACLRRCVALPVPLRV